MAFVSYGDAACGRHAALHLEKVLTERREPVTGPQMLPIREAVISIRSSISVPAEV